MTTIKLILKTILYQPLYNALIFLVWLTPSHNVGWAIIILTIVIRLILLPSSLKAARAQLKMRDLQPEMQKLQEKYKGDKQKQSQALMEFYRENKVNPLGSCLPLLIQFPILIALYYVFINGLTTTGFDLLYSFVPRPEFIHTVFAGIDLAKPDPFYILPVIAGALQFIQSRQIMPPANPKNKGDAQSILSRQMMYLMPVFTVIISAKLPAALPLYWIITTLFGVAQQWYAAKNLKKEGSVKKSSTSIIAGAEKQIEKVIKKGVEVTIRTKK